MGETGASAAGESRKNLEDLLKRIGQEPANDWGFRTEPEKVLWVLGRIANGYKVRVETVFKNVKKGVVAKRQLRRTAKSGEQAKA